MTCKFKCMGFLHVCKFLLFWQALIFKKIYTYMKKICFLQIFIIGAKPRNLEEKLKDDKIASSLLLQNITPHFMGGF